MIETWGRLPRSVSVYKEKYQHKYIPTQNHVKNQKINHIVNLYIRDCESLSAIFLFLSLNVEILTSKLKDFFFLKFSLIISIPFHIMAN